MWTGVQLQRLSTQKVLDHVSSCCSSGNIFLIELWGETICDSVDIFTSSSNHIKMTFNKTKWERALNGNLRYLCMDSNTSWVTKYEYSICPSLYLLFLPFTINRELVTFLRISKKIRAQMDANCTLFLLVLCALNKVYILLYLSIAVARTTSLATLPILQLNFH